MPSILQSAEGLDCEDQTAFNLAVWEKVLADSFLEKKELFFAAGADEVGFCDQAGQMQFFLKTEPEQKAVSILGPEFPRTISLR